MQIKWVGGLARHELDHHAPITWQVTGDASEADASRQEGPKGGVGSPTGFARGAGREWALPVIETEMRMPESIPRFEGQESPSRN